MLLPSHSTIHECVYFVYLEKHRISRRDNVPNVIHFPHFHSHPVRKKGISNLFKLQNEFTINVSGGKWTSKCNKKIGSALGIIWEHSFQLKWVGGGWPYGNRQERENVKSSCKQAFET